MQRSLNWIAATALALGLLAGCGGGSGGTPPNITAAAGGTVRSDDGRAMLVVPPGAAARDMTVRLVKVTPTTPADIGVLANHGYAIEGDGGELGADAELSITVDAAVPLAAVVNRHQALNAIAIGPPNLPECPEGSALKWNFDLERYLCAPWPFEPEMAVVNFPALTKIDHCRFLPAERRLACQIRNLLPKTVVLLHDREKPEGSMVISPSPMTTAGDVAFDITATDNKGVDTVLVLFIRRVNNVIVPLPPQSGVQMTAPPYTFTKTMGPAQNGEWTARVGIFDKNGNSRIWDQVFTVNIDPGPTPDVTPPTVNLAASATQVQVGDSVTLSAMAADDIGVTKVEFFKGATLLGERLAAPYELTTAAFTAGDVGTPQVFTARAHDAAGNTSTSAAVTVTVSGASTGDVYVNATSGADSNAGSAGAPFKTLAKAFTVVGSGGTVWLQNAAITEATEGTDWITGRTVPVGVTVRAVNPAGASIAFALKFAGNGSVVDTAFDMSRNGAIVATTGTVTVSRPTWVKLGGAGATAAITASGNAKVTMDAGGSPSHEYFASTGIAQLALISGSAELAVFGGVIDRLSGGGFGYMLGITDAGRVTLDGVMWTNAAGAVVAPTAIDVASTGGSVTLVNSTIDLTGAVDFTNGATACIRLSGGAVTTTQVTLTTSMLKKCPGDGIQIREGTPTIVLQNNSAIQSAGFHGLRSSVFAPLKATPTITLANSSITSNARSGIEMLGGGTLGMTSSGVMFNGTALPQGGVRMMGTDAYTLTMRNSLVQNNLADAGSGGVMLQGSAASSFDLGTKASPGANNIKFQGAGSTNLRVGVAAGVEVKAVGNTWTASTQGASNLGQYGAASNPCGSNPCVVNSGGGQNYSVSSGSLRLVDE